MNNMYLMPDGDDESFTVDPDKEEVPDERG